ncbi:MAG: hypothetical protein O2958_02875 [Gemmatimonadetes bacterium]|nr:hypothetical protein [Gemmatimonadota bacterium]MDA1102260.1 hypothetical protein [Gemmatimonadota bacterium]
MRFIVRALAAVALSAAVALPLQAQISSTDLDGLAPRAIGPANMSGRLVDIAVVESNTKTFYIAAATGGVWKTEDNGIRFTPVFEREAVHSVGDIEVHQRDTNIVWVGTGERANRQSSSWGDGVYKSTDSGATWTNMGLAESHHIGRIIMHPGDSDIVYVAAQGHLWGPNEDRGLYKSTDGGESWERILYVDPMTGAVDVAMDPSNPNILYAAMYQRQRRPWGFHGGGSGSGLYKSVDAGATWTKLTNSGLDNGLATGDIGRIGITVYRADPRIVYISLEQGERFNASTAYEQRLAGIYRSENRGDSWTFQGDWNPRPMYASQPMVDPNDDQRIYMLNSYSYSDDGGKTFTVPRDHRTHGDDRFVWVNPHDSDHVIKLDDGGLGISYDRGDHFLYSTNLPLSQYYRVSVDLANPYNVYGGLQDNGSWRGPNATYRSEGILNEDWTRWGGGDGFLSLVDTTNNRILYTESQYLGLIRNDMVTGASRDIRPNQPEGFIGARRNWTTWPDLDDPYERLGNAMAPGNWDGPFIISPHDTNTLYAGLNELFKSTDRGDSWTSLGDLTTGTDRRTLVIMDQAVDSFVLSLDDGIPYWPTLTAVAESEFTSGILYAGTDDGVVQVSRDDGATWRNVTAAMPGVPEMVWVNQVHASKSVAGRVYVAANNYRNDDYSNYLWRSEDDGRSWRSISGGLPAERVVRAVREDPRNPDVLYLGTEMGLFWSWNGGTDWTELKGVLPTVAVNDLVVHPRDNDLVLATHGRGIWILDHINALQEMTPAIAASAAHLFGVERAEQIRYRGEKAHTGNMIFEGDNPPSGAIFDYWSRAEGTQAQFAIFNAAGAQVAALDDTANRGVNRLVWDLRHSATDGSSGGPNGPLVVPGMYTVRMTADGVTREQRFRVDEDPRTDVDAGVRRQWTENLLGLWAGAGRAQTLSRAVSGMARRLDAPQNPLSIASGLETELRDLARETDELSSRFSGLYRSAQGWVGPLAADQRSQQEFLSGMLATLSSEWTSLSARLPGD